MIHTRFTHANHEAFFEATGLTGSPILFVNDTITIIFTFAQST